MRREEEIRKELKAFKRCLKDREFEFGSERWHLDYGYIMALEWVLAESEDDEE